MRWGHDQTQEAVQEGQQGLGKSGGEGTWVAWVTAMQLPITATSAPREDACAGAGLAEWRRAFGDKRSKIRGTQGPGNVSHWPCPVGFLATSSGECHFRWMLSRVAPAFWASWRGQPSIQALTLLTKPESSRATPKYLTGSHSTGKEVIIFVF